MFHAIITSGVARLAITIVALMAMTTPGLDLLIGISQISSGIGLSLPGFTVKRVADSAKALMSKKIVNNTNVVRYSSFL
ncbi:hypothetical protein ES706_02262 [subsurface metagenome]